MKKLWILLLLVVGIIPITAQEWTIADYLDGNNMLQIIKGDTITLQYKPSPQQFKYLVPDTTWIKHVKRPRERKHYTLQWYSEDYCTQKAKRDYTEYNARKFIFKNAVYDNNHCTFILYLHDPFLQKDVSYVAHEDFYILNPQVEEEIYEMLKDSVYGYKKTFSSQDELYKSTQLDSCKMYIQFSSYPYNRIVANYQLYMKDNKDAVLSAKGVVLRDRNLVQVDYDEYIEHNEKVREKLRQDSLKKAEEIRIDKILRLAKVSVNNAMNGEQVYGFEGDTMAIIECYQERKSWYGDLQYKLKAYAYGKEYTIELDAEEDINDYIQFLDTADYTYLCKRSTNGTDIRLATAQQWDMQKKEIILQDSIKNHNHVVWAMIYDFDNIERDDQDDYLTNKPTFGERVAVYQYKKNTYGAIVWGLIYRGEKFTVQYDDDMLKFEDESDIQYLKRVGDKHLDIRLAKAIVEEYKYREAEDERLRILRELKIQSLIKKKIFLLSQQYSYGGYNMCGVKAKFLNCYNKTIKYIDLKVVPYNKFDDVQPDDWSRKVETARCFGPLEPGSIGTWDFNDLFINEEGFITSFKITYIHIIFLDNTTVTYDGLQQVNKHYEYTYL